MPPDGGGRGQAAPVGAHMPGLSAQSLAAWCAQHLLKNWLSGLSALWAGSLPFHCGVVILPLRNEYWLRACFSNWITGGQSEARTACPAPAALAATWIVSKKSCLLEHLGITESCHRPLQWFIKRQGNGRKDPYLFLAPAACSLSFILCLSLSLCLCFLSFLLPASPFLPLFLLSLSSSLPIPPSFLLAFPFLFLCLLLVLIVKMREGKRMPCFRRHFTPKHNTLIKGEGP